MPQNNVSPPPGFREIGPSTEPPIPPGFKLVGAEPEQPGFRSRLGEATGFPMTLAQWTAAQPTRGDQIGEAVLGPAYTAGKTAIGYAKNLRDQYRQIKSDPNTRPAGGFDDPITRFLLRGVLAPVGGTGVANAGEDIGKGNLPGVGGDILGTLINALMLKRGMGPSSDTAVNRLTAAAGKDVHMPIQKTLPELQKAAAGGSYETPAETQYPYQYKPLDTANPVSGQFYHGTKAPIEDASELDPGSHGNEQSLYGIGAYLTDDPNVAQGYAKTRGRGAPGKVLSANIDNAKLLDLETRPPDLVHKIFANTLNQISGDHLPNTISGKQMFQQIRQAMEDEGYTSSHAQEILQDLNVELRSIGYDGFRHQGGGAIGKTPHNVAILFPDYGVGRPLNEIVKAGQPLPGLRPGSKTQFPAINPKSMTDFYQVASNAERTIRNEANAAMAPIAQKRIIPNSIATNIKGLITSDMVKTPEGRAAIAHINSEARKFENVPWSYEQLDAHRMNLNAQLNAFEKKSVGARYTAAKGNLNTAIDKTVADTIRDVVYPQMDIAAGKPQGYFRTLKQKQGNLIVLEDELNPRNAKSRTSKLAAETAEIQGNSRLSRENVSTHVGGSAVPRFSIYGLTNIIRKRNPLASANKRVKLGFSTGSPRAKAYTGNLPFRSSMFPATSQPEDNQ